jgi:hypothetical protein
MGAAPPWLDQAGGFGPAASGWRWRAGGGGLAVAGGGREASMARRRGLGAGEREAKSFTEVVIFDNTALCKGDFWAGWRF